MPSSICAQIFGVENRGVLIASRLRHLDVVFRLGKLIGGGIPRGVVHRGLELVIDRRDDL